MFEPPRGSLVSDRLGGEPFDQDEQTAQAVPLGDDAEVEAVLPRKISLDEVPAVG